MTFFNKPMSSKHSSHHHNPSNYRNRKKKLDDLNRKNNLEKVKLEQEQRNRETDQNKIFLSDYINSNIDYNKSSTQKKKAHSKNQHSENKKLNSHDINKLDEKLEVEIRKPTGEIAEEISDFLESEKENFVEYNKSKAKEIIKENKNEINKGKKNSEDFTTKEQELLESVEFYANNFTMAQNCNTGDFALPYNLVNEKEYPDKFKQIIKILRTDLNVCVYGIGSHINSLRSKIIPEMQDDHIIFELMGFTKKTVFRNLVARFMTHVLQEKNIKLDNTKIKLYQDKIEKAKKPSITVCFHFLKTAIDAMKVISIPKIIFIVYKLDKLLERDPEFLKEFKELQDGRNVKILFTIENFQTFWQKNDPEDLNSLKINYIFMVHQNIQTYELEGLSFSFNEDSDDKSYSSFVSVYSAFDEKLKEFIFYTLVYFKEKNKKFLSVHKVYNELYMKLIVGNKNQFNSFLKEPISHKILEVKNDMIYHFYSPDILNKIIYQMMQMEGNERFFEYKKKFQDEFKQFEKKKGKINNAMKIKDEDASSGAENHTNCKMHENSEDKDEDDYEDEEEDEENEDEDDCNDDSDDDHDDDKNEAW
jgi:hypothetical protein